MNKSRKIILSISLLCLSGNMIKGMEIDQDLNSPGLQLFSHMIGEYVLDPENSYIVANILGSWEDLNDDEKVAAYRKAMELGLNLTKSLAIDKPKQLSSESIKKGKSEVKTNKFDEDMPDVVSSSLQKDSFIARESKFEPFNFQLFLNILEEYKKNPENDDIAVSVWSSWENLNNSEKVAAYDKAMELGVNLFEAFAIDKPEQLSSEFIKKGKSEQEESSIARKSKFRSLNFQSFLNILEEYKKNPENDDIIVSVLSSWEGLNNNEKVNAYEKAMQLGVNLSKVFAIDKPEQLSPRFLKKPRVEQNTVVNIPYVPIVSDEEFKKEENPDEYEADSLANLYERVLAKRNEIQNEIERATQVSKGRHTVLTQESERLAYENANILNENNRIRAQIEEFTRSNAELQARISQLSGSVSRRSESNMRANAMYNNLNRRLQQEINDLNKEVEDLKRILNK